MTIIVSMPTSLTVVVYAPFDTAVNICVCLGIGCMIRKADFNAAFCLFPISPFDLILLGFMLDDQFFINSTMVFGARSSCHIFETFAKAMEMGNQEKKSFGLSDTLFRQFLPGTHHIYWVPEIDG